MRKDRLTQGKQFAAVRKQGSSWSSELLVMKTLPNGLEWSRYGVVVSRRVGEAVVRNRVKRLLRECMRSMPLEPGWDVVFIARKAAAVTDYHTIKKAVEVLFRQAHLAGRAAGNRA